MPQAEFTALVERAVKAQVTADNQTIYTEKLLVGAPNFTKVPHSIYYYHIKFVRDGVLGIKWYYHDNGDTPILYTKMRDYITPLAKNGHAGGQSPAPIGRGLDNMEWHRKSYLVFLMDNKNWRFVKFEDGEVAIACVSGPGHTDNNTFFDADDIEIDVSEDGTGEFRSAVFFINHMKKNAQGDDLTASDSQPFKFTMAFRIIDDTGDTAPAWIDPDGTNLGPPQSPP